MENAWYSDIAYNSRVLARLKKSAIRLSLSNLQAASRSSKNLIYYQFHLQYFHSTSFLPILTLTLENPTSVQESLGLLRRQNPFPTRTADIKLLEMPTVRKFRIQINQIQNYHKLECSSNSKLKC